MKIQSRKGSKSTIVGIIDNFASGMNTMDSDTKLKDGEHRILKNVKITEQGGLLRRGGFREVGKINWESLKTSDADPNFEPWKNNLLEVLQNQGVENLVSQTDREFDIQINDWKLREQPQIKAINSYRVNLNNQTVFFNNELKILHNETIYNYLGNLRKNNNSSDENKTAFPQNCQKAQQPQNVLKNKGLNLFLSAFGFTYLDQINQLKGPNTENKIIKGINTFGLQDIKDLWIKRIDENDYLILAFSGNDQFETVVFSTKTSDWFFQGDGDSNRGWYEIKPNENNRNKKWREIADWPNLPFKVKLDLSFKQYNIEETKSISLISDEQVPLTQEGDNFIFEFSPLKISKRDDANYLYTNGEPILFLNINGFTFNATEIETLFVLEKSLNFVDWEPWIEGQEKKETQYIGNLFDYQLVFSKQIGTNNKEEIYRTPLSSEPIIELNNLNLSTNIPENAEFKLFVTLVLVKKEVV